MIGAATRLISHPVNIRRRTPVWQSTELLGEIGLGHPRPLLWIPSWKDGKPTKKASCLGSIHAVSGEGPGLPWGTSGLSELPTPHLREEGRGDSFWAVVEVRKEPEASGYGVKDTGEATSPPKAVVETTTVSSNWQHRGPEGQAGVATSQPTQMARMDEPQLRGQWEQALRSQSLLRVLGKLSSVMRVFSLSKYLYRKQNLAWTDCYLHGTSVPSSWSWLELGSQEISLIACTT